MTDISGKAAVVTGGGSGIGMGLAKELARQGASVAVADIMLEKAQKVTAAIQAAGGKAVAIQCDVCERDSIRRMKEEAEAALGPIQLVFANAGATSFDPLTEMSDDDVDWILQVNLHGVMNTTRAFLPGMIAAGGGHICATASMAGLLPGWIPVHVPYSAAKAGIIGLMMNLALEMKEHNIYTTSYCPGGVVDVQESALRSGRADDRPQYQCQYQSRQQRLDEGHAPSDRLKPTFNGPTFNEARGLPRNRPDYKQDRRLEWRERGSSGTGRPKRSTSGASSGRSGGLSR